MPDPRLLAGEADRPVGRRVPPPAGARPLVAPVPARVSPANQESRPGSDLAPVHAAQKGGHDQTLSQNRPILTGVSGVKGGQVRHFRHATAETPAERAAKTPAKTPAPTRARERNPRTKEPKNTPNPPQGGRSENSITIEETYATGSGRKRHRRVNVNLDEVRRTLGVPGPSDHADWSRIRKLLAEAVGESTFAIWFEPVELIAIDPDGSLVLHAPPGLRGWLQARFGLVVAQAAEARRTRNADRRHDPERSDGRAMSGRLPFADESDRSVRSPVDDSAGDQENSRHCAADHGDPPAPAGQPVAEALHGGGGPLRSCRVPEQREL